MRLYITILALLSFATPAASQSAEETVAYMMIGAEDGTNTEAFGGAWKVTFSGGGRVGYFIRNKDQVEEIGVEKLSDCEYIYRKSLFELQPTRKIFKADQYELNFRNVREYDITNEQPDGNGFIFRMKGLNAQCSPHPNHPEAISCDDQIGFINFGDAERAKNALKYFKEKFCPGKSF